MQLDNEKYNCSKCKFNGYHASRNCTKYFPNDIKDKPFDRWCAVYRTQKGTAYEIPDTQIEECPVSFITPLSIELIQIANRTSLAKEKTGAGMYGPDLSKYPSKFVDVITILEREVRKETNERYEVEASER